MITLFWFAEYIKVLAAYLFVFFVWPSVVFKNLFKGKSLTFKFAFCMTAQIVIVNTVVIGLGLCHILYPWLVRVLFYATFIIFLILGYEGRKAEVRKVGRVITGTYGQKSYLYHMINAFAAAVKRLLIRIRSYFRGRIWEYTLLAGVIIFGVTYFTYGAFQNYSYGCGDLYVHHEWIYGLINGQVFSEGVYPEGMHCIVYLMHEIFGIRVYSILQFLQCIHVTVFLISVYMMLREIFRWKYTPVIMLMMLLTIDVKCALGIVAFSRLQWSLPQEFTLFAPFFSVTFLVRYLRRKEKYDENLMVFALSIAASLATHFYTTIMAFFMCVAFVPVVLHRILKPKKFGPLFAAVIAGAVVAILPMGAALAQGIPFQGSIGWAVSVINGTDNENTGENTSIEDSITLPGSENVVQMNPEDVNITDDNTSGQPVPVKDSIITKIKKAVNNIYWGAYVSLYTQTRANIILIVTALSLIIALTARIVLMIRSRAWENADFKADRYDNYISLVFAELIIISLYAAPYLGLPELVSGPRLVFLIHILVVSVCVIPLDFIFSLCRERINIRLEKGLAFAGIMAIYLIALITGTFRGYLYNELTRYNGAVLTTESIARSMDNFSYTVVSPVDELYHVNEYGYHEEAVEFVNQCVKDDYKLPSENLFIYVEKHPLLRGQMHFYSGPAFFASTEKYPAFYEDMASQGEEIKKLEISEERAEPPYTEYMVDLWSYTNEEIRACIESRLYKWCMEFAGLYPNELRTYYEDEDFVCYYIRQNPDCIYQLGFGTGETGEIN